MCSRASRPFICASTWELICHRFSSLFVPHVLCVSVGKLSARLILHRLHSHHHRSHTGMRFKSLGNPCGLLLGSATGGRAQGVACGCPICNKTRRTEYLVYEIGQFRILNKSKLRRETALESIENYSDIGCDMGIVCTRCDGGGVVAPTQICSVRAQRSNQFTH